MMDVKSKHDGKRRRHARVRRKVSGTTERPRLAVYRSNRHIYAQLVDDSRRTTIASASDADAKVSGDKTARAKAVGELLAKRASEAGITSAVFDRGGRLYHGRVAALAEGAREGGLTI
jgi:large subunit ribosomal protein L18